MEKMSKKKTSRPEPDLKHELSINSSVEGK